MFTCTVSSFPPGDAVIVPTVTPLPKFTAGMGSPAELKFDPVTFDRHIRLTLFNLGHLTISYHDCNGLNSDFAPLALPPDMSKGEHHPAAGTIIDFRDRPIGVELHRRQDHPGVGRTGCAVGKGTFGKICETVERWWIVMGGRALRQDTDLVAVAEA